MSTMEITVSKKLLYGIGIGFVALIVLLLFGGKSLISNSASVNGNKLIAGSSEKFAFLSGSAAQCWQYLRAGTCLS